MWRCRVAGDHGLRTTRAPSSAATTALPSANAPHPEAVALVPRDGRTHRAQQVEGRLRPRRVRVDGCVCGVGVRVGVGLAELRGVVEDERACQR